MWQRNLLFLGLLALGLVLLVGNLLPPRPTRLLGHYDGPVYQQADFRAVVERIDQTFHSSWAERKIEPARPASELIVARRLALGLMGTIPALDEIRQLEYLPPGECLSWWIDHVLQDPRCADYLAERLARSYVGTEDGPFLFYRRRRFVAYLREQLMRDRPYNQLVADLIATQGLWTDRPATNFLTVTCKPDQNNQPDPIRLAGRTARAFLGIRLDCAECHDHPYASWKQSDFQGLAAFFGQTHVGFTGIYDGSGEFEVLDKSLTHSQVIAPHVPAAPDLLPESGTRREQLAAWITAPQNPYFARATVNRFWAIVYGRPLVDPVDNLESDAPIPAALDILADDFVRHGYDCKRLLRLLASLEVFRLDSTASVDRSTEAEQAWAYFPFSRLRPEQVAGAVVQAASVTTVTADFPLLLRIIRWGEKNEFVHRYGDRGEDEFSARAGTIPQRLLLMNGKLVQENTNDGFFNASLRIAWLAPDPSRAIESAYLAVLTRRPTPEESAYFEQQLARPGSVRKQQLSDLYWVLINATEFSWNH